jgi:RNA polymerase sigma-70 factor (ECF subfamily)
MSPERQQVIDRFRQGSAEAFRVLYDEYSNRIYRFCLKLTANEVLAGDAYQETFIKIYENSNKFEGENFGGWAYTICRHTCLNLMRSQKNHADFDEALGLESEQERGDIMLKKTIDGAIQSLSLPLREALILREYQECTYQEIATILDIELSLAKVRVHRARIQLRKILEPVVREYNGY